MSEYTVDIQPFPKQVTVTYKGTVLADTKRALELLETNHEPVFYIPLKDVRQDLLQATDHHTHCPLKGDASYWSLKLGDESLDNLVWAYKDPIPNAAEISGYVAFYRDRVSIEVID